jgi:hypothetical protein
MKDKKYYYTKEEWDRLGCGSLPEDRDIAKLNPQDINWGAYLVFPERLHEDSDEKINPYSQV